MRRIILHEGCVLVRDYFDWHARIQMHACIHADRRTDKRADGRQTDIHVAPSFMPKPSMCPTEHQDVPQVEPGPGLDSRTACIM